MGEVKRSFVLVGRDVDNDKYSWLANSNASILTALQDRTRHQLRFYSPGAHIAAAAPATIAKVVRSALKPSPFHVDDASVESAVGSTLYTLPPTLVRSELEGRLTQILGLLLPSAGEQVIRPIQDSIIEDLPQATESAAAQSVVDSLAQHTPPHSDIALGVYVWNDRLVRKITERLREIIPNARIVLGGPQITGTPAGELEHYYPHADLFIRGEAEDALPIVLSAADPVVYPGVHYAGQADVGGVAYVKDLSSLRSPFRLGLGAPVWQHMKARWETKRGCPYSCSFCQHRGRTSGIRYFAADRLAEESSSFTQAEATDITVLDPTFNVGKTYMGILEQLRKGGYRRRLALQCRFELVTQEFLRLVQPFQTCLEFGLQTIHSAEAEALNRKMDLDAIRRAIRMIRNAGIHFEVDLMYGLPWQTLDSFQRSIEFCQTEGVPVLRCWPLALLRGTGIERRRREWNLRFRGEDDPVVISGNTFDEAEWIRMDKLATEVRAGGDARHELWKTKTGLVL